MKPAVPVSGGGAGSGGRGQGLPLVRHMSPAVEKGAKSAQSPLFQTSFIAVRWTSESRNAPFNAEVQDVSEWEPASNITQVTPSKDGVSNVLTIIFCGCGSPLTNLAQAGSAE